MKRVLVADAHVLCRKRLGDHLERLADVELVGRSPTGRLALTQLKFRSPDVVLIGLDLPELDPAAFTKAISALPGPVKVVALTAKGGATGDQEALAKALGASELLERPARPADEARLMERLERLLRGPSAQTPPPPRFIPAPIAARPHGPVAVVAIGLSTGGPHALMRVIPRLPRDLGVPVLIVQHMPSGFTHNLALSLDRASPLSVVEAEDGQAVESNRVYLAPGGRQMKVVREKGAVRVALNDDPPENHCRPAADYLFRSVAEVFAERSLGVIMTGMGDDGAKGLKVMHAAGAYVLGQDQATCTIYGMPRCAAEAGVVDEQVSLPDMADHILRRVRRRAG